MTDPEITALAREYAEEIYPNLSDKIISRRTQEIKEAERVIRFLLRRFCLVEKSKVKDVYMSARKDVKDGYKSKIGGMVAMGGVKEALLESLFPDFGKEVEE